MLMSPIPAQGTTPVFPWPSPKLVRRTRVSITAASRTVMEKSLLSLTSQLKVNVGFSAARQSPGPLPAQRDTRPDPILFVSFQFSNSFQATRSIIEVSDMSWPLRDWAPHPIHCSVVHSSNQVEDDRPGRALEVHADSASVPWGLERPLSRLEFQ